MRKVSEKRLMEVLNSVQGVGYRAAKVLKVEPQTVYERMKRLGVPVTERLVS